MPLSELDMLSLVAALELAQGNKAWCIKRETVYCVEIIALPATAEQLIALKEEHLFQVTIIALSTGEVEKKRFGGYLYCCSFLRQSGLNPNANIWHWR
jgi:hypothetical protein